MNKKTLHKIFIIAGIALCAAVLLIMVMNLPAFGDVGGHSGTHSFSGGSSSSKSHSSGGSSSSSRSGSMDWVFWLFLLRNANGDVTGPNFIAIGIAVAVIIGFIVLKIMKGKKSSGSKPVFVKDTFDKSKLRNIDEYKTQHTDFNEEEFDDDMANWYMKMQNAWTKKDFSEMEPYFSDSYFAQLKRQLQQIINEGKTNYVTNIGVLSTNIEGWWEEDDQEFVSVIIKARITDWTEIDKTGEVVSGDKKNEKFMTYRWVLSKSKGDDVSRENALNCPNCGATVDANESAKCPYCGSILHSEKHSWVIDSIQGIEQINTK